MYSYSYAFLLMAFKFPAIGYANSMKIICRKIMKSSQAGNFPCTLIMVPNSFEMCSRLHYSQESIDNYCQCLCLAGKRVLCYYCLHRFILVWVTDFAVYVTTLCAPPLYSQNTFSFLSCLAIVIMCLNAAVT